MARVAVAYAHPPSQPEAGRPLAVVAQDDSGVTLAAVPQNVVTLATALGLPSQAFVGWVESRQRLDEPVRVTNAAGTGSERVEPSDPRWLDHFVTPGYVDTVSFGPIQEVAGTAAEAAERVATSLAPAT